MRAPSVVLLGFLGLPLGVACQRTVLTGGAGEGGAGAGGAESGLAGAKRYCGQGLPCSPEEACQVTYFEGAYRCSCVGALTQCETFGGGASPPAPPGPPGFECGVDACGYFVAGCLYDGPGCSFEVSCDPIEETLLGITGSCE